jgi:glycosyltransferase involved in cell wall biosynthesis
MVSEVIYVNDGSSDNSLNLLHGLKQKHSNISILDLSRNFGKEIAMAAGFDHANSDAVVIIDADLQDPPEVIPRLIEVWRTGFDVVCAKRNIRHGETLFKKASAKLFYRIVNKLSKVKLPTDVGDFRLLSLRAVDSLKLLREQNRYSKGLYVWIGYAQTTIIYDRDPRFAGKSKWNYIRLCELAIEGITSFSTIPLKVASLFGVCSAFASLLFMLYIFFETLFFHNPIKGYPSLMVVVLFLGGVQLICLGILGEYIGRIFLETKARPLYLLNSYIPTKRT